jgi:hypothetical protein
MAILTVHHWHDLEGGLREMARVARRRAVLLTWIADAPPFWLTEDYFPQIIAHDRTIFPPAAMLVEMLERTIGPVDIAPVPVPHDCIDGFLGAYWRRPDLYLSADRRSAISSFPRIDAEPGVAKLRSDLASGRWTERNGHLLALDTLDVGYRIFSCAVGGKG